jgi:hypothetical protein
MDEIDEIDHASKETTISIFNTQSGVFCGDPFYLHYKDVLPFSSPFPHIYLFL